MTIPTPAPANATKRGFEVRALGEIAIRCKDFGAMRTFYRDVLGLEELEGSHAPGIVFFALGEDYGGHITVLALFAHDAGRPALHEQSGPPIAGGRSSLHHIALTVDHGEQDAAMAWFAEQGVDYAVQQFEWIGWRGVFIKDPEGNTVELVAKVPASSP